MKTVTHKGKEYQLGAVYEFSDDDLEWCLGIFTGFNDRMHFLFSSRDDEGCIEPYKNIRTVGGVLGVIKFAPVELVHGKAYQFESKSKGEAIAVEGVYSDSGSVFITVHGSFPKAVCTNIQPLTVANK